MDPSEARSRFAGARAARLAILLAIACWPQSLPAAEAAFGDRPAGESVEGLQSSISRAVEERERLIGMLASLAFVEALPSRANFLLCRLKGLDAGEVRDRLARRGIFVRHFDAPRLRDCLRITVGLPSQSEPLVRALREIGAELGC